MVNKAAIDIGSNSIRLLIGQQNGSDFVISYSVKTPLRLGTDVFSSGYVGDQNLEKLLMVCFEYKKHLTEHNVQACHVVATSALREAINTKDIIREIYDKTGFDIHVISYQQEADYVYRAVQYFMEFQEGRYAIMDIGGGSLELIQCDKKGIQKKASFPLGTVKILSQVSSEKDLASYLKQHQQALIDFLSPGKPFQCCVGIGGNMDYLYDLTTSFYNKKIIPHTNDHSSENKSLNVEDINSLLKKLINISFQERVDHFDILPDRADILIPALFVTQIFCKAVDQRKVYIPKVGVKEGVLLSMFEQ